MAGCVILIVLAVAWLAGRRTYPDIFQRVAGAENALRLYSDATRNGTVGFDEDKATFFFLRGEGEHLRGSLLAAHSDYVRSFNLDRRNDFLLASMADIDFRFDHLQDALSECDEALRLNPKNALALNNRAQVWLRKKEYQHVFDDASNALANMDKLTDPLRQQSLLLRASANRHFGRAVQSDNDVKAARACAPINHAKVKDARELESKFSRKFVEPGFVLCTDSSEEDSNKQIQFITRFMRYVDTSLCHFQPDEEFHIFVFGDREQYHQFLRSIKDTRFLPGNYDGDYDAIFTYAQSGVGTFAKTLMHKFVEELPFADPWSKEGIPALFEKLYGYEDGDSLHLVVAGQNSWRIRALGGRLTRLSLAEVISNLYPVLSESEERLAAAFLCRQGKLRSYLQLCQTGPTGEYDTTFESVFGRSGVQLSPEWKSYLSLIVDRRDEIEKLPVTTIFHDKDSFENFKKSCALDLLEP
jgi:tetratricopeptide (TPR) repeat protein